ncbi:hypothetical protein MBLNU457_3735t1 [Dothideomycetes sp. NU457]
MAPHENGKITSEEEADLAKAFQELAKGEQTATALENHLTALEARIEALLAQANDNRGIAEGADNEDKRVGGKQGDGTGTESGVNGTN